VQSHRSDGWQFLQHEIARDWFRASSGATLVGTPSA